MNRFKWGAITFTLMVSAVLAPHLILGISAPYQEAGYSVPVYHAQGGNQFVVNNDGSLVVRNGGILDIETTGVWKIDSVVVTVSAAELNALTGTGLSSTELGYLDGVVAGTRTASKAIVVDASGTINALDITALALGTVAMTATAAELNALAGTGLDSTELGLLNGVVAGTRTASKALTVDANEKIDTLDITVPLFNGTTITVTGDELNELAGVGLVSDELALLDGAVSGTMAVGTVLVPDENGTIDQIDITALSLGTVEVTASAAELNALAGTGLSSTELGYLDGVIPGVLTESKALVVSTTGTIDVLDIIIPVVSGTTVTASGAELNILDGVTADANELNYLAGQTGGTVVANKAIVVDVNKKIDRIILEEVLVGAAAGTTVTVKTYGRLTLTNATEATATIAGFAATDGVLFSPIGDEIFPLDVDLRAYPVAGAFGIYGDTACTVTVFYEAIQFP